MGSDTLPDFPDEFLSIRGAFIYGKSGEWAIIVALQPFELDARTVKTQIVLDSFAWDVQHPRELAGTTHEYSWIDGSIYLRSAHHPVDVSRISFGAADLNTIEATIECNFDFDVEGGGFQNRPVKLTCALECREPRGICSFRVIK